MTDSEKSSLFPETGGAGGSPGAVNPAALSIEQVAALLGVLVAMVQAHIDAGAPTGPGGTINLVHYAAWLNKELADLHGD
jgi:hypothetical protein